MTTEIEMKDTTSNGGEVKGGEISITPISVDTNKHHSNVWSLESSDTPRSSTDNHLYDDSTIKGLIQKHWRKSKKEILFILKWAWPMVLSNLLNNVSYLFINLIFVGRLSRDELAAAALANTWTYGTQAFSLGINNACDTLVSQSYGAQNFVLVGLTVQRATIVTTAMTVLVTVLWALTEKFLLLVRQDPTISYMAFKYVLYLLPGLWFGNVLNVMQKYIQGQGLMLPSIYIGIALNALNVLFNFVFVTGLGSYSGMGYVGSALSTSISRIVSCFLMLAYIRLFKLHEKTWFGWSRECWNWDGFKEYLKLGVPAMIQHASESWGFEILTILAGLIDSVSLDAHSITYNFTMLTYQIPSGIAIAVSVRVGHLLGSRNGSQARTASWVGFGITLICMIVIAIILFTLRYQLGYIYTHHEEVIEKIAVILPIAALFQIFDGSQTIFQGAVRGMGRTKIGAAANFIAFYVIGIPLSAILAFPVKVGVTGLWWGLCIGLVTISVGLGIFIIRVDWPDEVENAKIRTLTSMNRISTSYLQRHRGSFSSDSLPPGLVLDDDPTSLGSSRSSDGGNDGADSPSKSPRKKHSKNKSSSSTPSTPTTPRKGVNGARSGLGLYTEGPAVDQNKGTDDAHPTSSSSSHPPITTPPPPPTSQQQMSMNISIDNSSTFVDSTNSSSVCSSLPTTPAPIPANPTHINTQLNFINAQLNTITNQLNNINVQLHSIKSLNSSSGSVTFGNSPPLNGSSNNLGGSAHSHHHHHHNHNDVVEIGESSSSIAGGVVNNNGSATTTHPITINRPNLTNSHNSGSAGNGSDNGSNTPPKTNINNSYDGNANGNNNVGGFDLLSHINNSINSINDQVKQLSNESNNQFKESTGMTPPSSPTPNPTPSNNNNNNVVLSNPSTTTNSGNDRDSPINVDPNPKPIPILPQTGTSSTSIPIPIPSSPSRSMRSGTMASPNSPVNNLIRNFNQISEQATRESQNHTIHMLRRNTRSGSFSGLPISPPRSPRTQITQSHGLFTPPLNHNNSTSSLSSQDSHYQPPSQP